MAIRNFHTHIAGRQLLILLALICILFLSAACSGGGGGGIPAGSVSATAERQVFGVVYNAADDLPLEGVSITATGTGSTATTDTSGRFALSVAAAGTYDLTATLDGYTYAQRRAVIDDNTNRLVAVKDMFLTLLDSAVIAIGPSGGTGANSDGSIQIEVPAGALGATTNMRATWFNRGKDLPNDLPVLSHFTYACELTPDGQTFSVPVTMRMENTRGFAPGTPVPVGVYNPTTLQWEHESMGTISADGQWVVYQVSHFSPRDCNLGRQGPDGSGEAGDAEDETSEDGLTKNNQACGSISAGSQIGVMDGHLSVDHVIPAYRSLNQMHTVGLQYNSHRRGFIPPVLGLRYDITATGVETPSRMRFTAEIAGQRIEKYFIPVEDEMYFGFVWDGTDGLGRAVPEGDYAYTMTLANEYEAEFATVPAFGGSAVAGTGVMADEYLAFPATFTGTLNLDRGSNVSPYGTGWGLAGLYRLQRETGKITIYSGHGDIYPYEDDGLGNFQAGDGDFTTLLENPDHTFTWRHPDGTRITFDPQGLAQNRADSNGNTVRYTYDTNGRLTTIADPLNQLTQFNYDSNGYLSAINDPFGRQTLISINDNGDLVQITNPDGTSRRFSYNSQNRMTDQTDAGGKITRYTYNRYGAITQVLYPDGNSAQFTGGFANFMAAGAGTEASPAPAASPTYTDPSGQTYTFGVNSFGTRTRITNPLGFTTRMLRNADDQITMVELPGDIRTVYSYDTAGRMNGITGLARAIDQVTVTYDDTFDLPLTVDDPAAGTITATYDSNGNLATTTTMEGASYTFTYNSAGQRTGITIGGRTHAFAYNTEGNLTRITDPTSTAVDEAWRFTYDTYGNITQIIDPDGVTHSATYDVMNRLLSTTNGTGHTVNYTYALAKGSVDLSGKGPSVVIASIRDGAGNTTQYTYDSMYRLTRRTDPLGNSHAYAYDANGRLTSYTNPNGGLVAYTYDAAGRLTAKTLDSSATTTYTYDATIGKPTTLTNANVRLGMTYGTSNLVDTVTTRFLRASIFDADVAYTYRVGSSYQHRVDLSSGATSTYFASEYDATHGRLPTYVTAGDFTGIQLYLSYDSGRRLSRWYQTGWPVWADFGYDDVDRLTSAVYQNSAAESAVFSWTYSPGGRLAQKTDTDGTHSYTYDATGRLTGVTYPAGTFPAESYTYDAAGNRRIAGSESGFTFDAANRLTQDPTYTYAYDAAGNLIRKTHRVSSDVTAYEYNAENRLVQITLPSAAIVRFRYDPLGRLCEKQTAAGTFRYVYDQDETLAVFDGTGNLIRRYLNGSNIDRQWGVITGGIGGNHYLTGIDRLGTVEGFVRTDGTFDRRYRYEAFGTPHPDGSIYDERMFGGRDYDADSGLYYLRNRFYDPASGRFLQPDPLPALAATAPYTYAANSPTNFRDPFGLEPTVGAQADALGNLLNKRAIEPAINRGVEEGLGRLGDVPNALNPSIVSLPGVGTLARTGWTQYNQWKDVINVFGADNPLEAGISWYSSSSRWWNPARHYMDDFLTMGGQLERREARIRPICGLFSNLGLIVSRRR